MSDKSLKKLASLVAESVVTALEEKGMFSGAAKRRNEMTAYQKTEKLLYNYVGFKRIVEDKLQQIEDLKKYGIPEKDGSIVAYSPRGGTVQGTVLQEESVEQAIRTVQDSIVQTQGAIDLVDNGMAMLKGDPYYKILEMRYFEGRTQDDIAAEFNCSQVTISNNKSRLVRELSMQMFPDQVASEIIN